MADDRTIGRALVELAQQDYDEQKYYCDELKTARKTVEHFCADSEERDSILQELDECLDGCLTVLRKYAAALDMAEAEYRQADRARSTT